jgi:delta24(24(1))-sterol reductase
MPTRSRSKSKEPKKAARSASKEPKKQTPKKENKAPVKKENKAPVKKDTATPPKAKKSDTKKDKSGDYGGISSEHGYEFGGPIGVSALMIWSHYITLYFWFCLEKHQGNMVIPYSLPQLYMYIDEFKTLFIESGIPSVNTWINYAIFFIAQLLLAAIVPAFTMDGLPTAPHGKKLKYHCNGYSVFYICLAIMIILDSTYRNYGYGFDLTQICLNFGEYLVASIIIGDATSLFWYIYGLMIEQPGVSPPTGNIPYDFFMGTCLYPRIDFGFGTLEVDIKMVAEARWSWITLALLTLSCTLQQYRETGHVTFQMFTMLIAHLLYANATVKGEHCIPPTWDMFYEKFGWMLNFWNISGVPFLYCFQAMYVQRHQSIISNNFPYTTIMTVAGVTIQPFAVFTFVFLIAGYYLFDSANHQKAYFKTQIRRNTWPLVPWSIIEDPVKYIQTPRGKLLLDGWYSFGRKLQYTGDIIMALAWGFCCGFNSPLPYFYAFFFTSMISHRQWRDEIRCREKYGIYWDKFTELVPNIFLPSLSYFTWLAGGEHPISHEVLREIEALPDN